MAHFHGRTSLSCHRARANYNRHSAARAPPEERALSYRVWSFRFWCVRFKRRCLTLVFGCDEQTPVIFRDRSWIIARRQVSPQLSVKSFPTEGSHQHTQFRRCGSKHSPPTCRQTKNKSSCMSPKLGASCTDGWRSPQSQECTKRWAFKTPFFINSITPQLPSPFPPCLISAPPWAKVIICSFIKLDNIPCVVEACSQESRPYCSSLQHFVLLAHYFTHALLFYQALLK